MDYDFYFKQALDSLINDIKELIEIYNILSKKPMYSNIIESFYKNMEDIIISEYAKNIKDQFYIIHKGSPEGQQFKRLILDKKDEGYPTSAPKYDCME